MRENATEKFSDLYEIAIELAAEVGETIRVPRTTKRQVHRENYDVNSPEDYYRLSIFIPFVDHFISHLKERFLKHKNVLKKIQNILPKFIIDLDEHELNDTVDVFLAQWPNITDICDSIVKKEALLWQQMCIVSEEKSFTFIDSLHLCNSAIFPNIHNMLKVCATLPVSVASAERSFFSLKRIKSYLRNATGEIRLNGLAALNIHREISINPIEVLDKFTKKNRRMLL